MNYKESVHMRLSADQKKAILNMSTRHSVSMSTALRWMIEYCLADPSVLNEVVATHHSTKKEVPMDGVV